MSPEELAVRSVLAFALTWLSGIVSWQYVSSDYPSDKSRMKLIFLMEAIVTASAGLYLFVSTVL